MRYFLAFYICLLVLTACFQNIEEFPPSTTQAIDETSDDNVTAIATTPADTGSTLCDGFDWSYTYFHWQPDEGITISEIDTRYCNDRDYTLYSHVITVFDYTGTLGDGLYSILENIVRVLPEYPPKRPDVTELIELSNLLTEESWTFTYTDAIAAYESGLRGLDLAEALYIETDHLTPYPIHLTETVVSGLATANASSPLSFSETREALIATATAQIFPTLTNEVSFWETQRAAIVQTATLAGGTDEAFYSTAIPAIDEAIVSQRYFSENCYDELSFETRMEYFITDAGYSLTTAQIYTVANNQIICEEITVIPVSYYITLEIDNAAPQVDIEKMVFLVLEDAVSRLPDYPPFDERVQNVGIGICFAAGGWCTAYGDFTRSDAIAAYESGLRGADLAEALGVHAP